MSRDQNTGRFSLERLISANNLAQSWCATDLTTGRRCFVKLPAQGALIGDSTVRSVLLRSYECQKTLRNPRILSAVRKHSSRTGPIIEYPWVELSRWKRLTPGLFWKHVPYLLVEISIAVDYLHLLGLVHGDLKLGNMLIDTKRHKPHIKLIDLDFLTQCHSLPDGKIFGTPEHIAPEVLGNELITTESDIYSLGISLRQYLETLDGEPSLPSTNKTVAKEKLRPLIMSLTQQDRLHRPRLLLGTLNEHGLIDDHAYDSALRTLLSMILGTNLRKRTSRTSKRTTLGRFLTKDARVVGLTDDLTQDLETSFDKNALATMLAFKTLIRGSDISLCADYWQINVPDRLAVTLFERTGSILGQKSAVCFCKTARTPAEIRQLIMQATSLRDKGLYLKAFLCMKNVAEQAQASAARSDMRQRRTILIELADLARTLNRPKEAIVSLTSALDLFTGLSRERLETLYKRVFLGFSTEDLREVDAYVDQGIQEARELNDDFHQLRFQRQKAWILAARGRHQKALEQYWSVIEQAKERGYTDQTVLSYNDLGTLAWRNGDFAQAIEYLEKSLTLAKRHKLQREIIAPLTNLSLLSVELSKFKNAIKYAKMAIKYVSEPYDRVKLRYMYANIALSYIRLADYGKAEYWLQKLATLESAFKDSVYLARYHYYLGWMETCRGHTVKAQECLNQALRMLSDPEHDRIKGKVYHCLAESTLYRGEYDSCRRYLDKAKAVFQRTGDQASLTEIDFLRELSQHQQSEEKRVSILEQHLEALLAHNCRYYAALCLFYILLTSETQPAEPVWEQSHELRDLINKGETPLYRALGQLTTLHSAQPASYDERLYCLKSIYRILELAGQIYLALLVCEKISQRYLTQGNLKLARKFLGQSMKLAESLQNKVLTKAFYRRIQDMTTRETDQHLLAKSVHGVSEILKSIVDYQHALESVVEYAVRETGAERGVLLLRPDEESDFQVKASVGCDESSLEDIRDISRSIPKNVARDRTALVIENALADDRTKGYKSIILHNILSVMCVPVTINERILAVLYLDHHTIPALFEKEDVIFISSISNFVSVILSQAQIYRKISVSAERLGSDLVRMGRLPQLITQNETMRDMLARLPEIARSKASVLIVGESGIGKEILSEMIHSMSLRASGPFVKLNCAAIASTLIESELFGIVDKAATGVAARDGMFSAADAGTLFLDEIGDMPPEIQAKVLGVLENQEFQKVGSNRLTSVDVRFVYATNKDLREQIDKKQFREDLYYRISTFTIEIPPLRERPDDIMLLADHFVKIYARDEHSYPRFSASTTEALLSYAWPGNVRELRNLVERLCILFPGRAVQFSDLPKEFVLHHSRDSRVRRQAETVEKATIRSLLRANDWNQSEVARLLKMPLTTLRRKIKKYNVSKPH